MKATKGALPRALAPYCTVSVTDNFILSTTFTDASLARHLGAFVKSNNCVSGYIFVCIRTQRRPAIKERTVTWFAIGWTAFPTEHT